MFDTSSASSELAPAFALRRLIFGHRITEMIAVAIRLGLADQLGDTEQTGYELAARLAINPQALQRLLRALASVGVVASRGHDRFALMPIRRSWRPMPWSQHTRLRRMRGSSMWAAISLRPCLLAAISCASERGWLCHHQHCSNTRL
jgi:hypothetical protein